jgi:aminoglycoside phosphotransferase (APT) family kinase protein
MRDAGGATLAAMTTDLAERLRALAPKLGGVDITGLRRLSGGASQETWAFDSVGAHGPVPYILRRAPGGMDIPMSGNAIGLPAEAAVIAAARAAAAPAPKVAHVCTPEDGIGPGYVMERLAGETIARKILRDELYAAARPRLARQCGEALARIHAAQGAAVDALPVSDAQDQLDRYEEIYRSFESPRPIFDLAFATLRRQTRKAGAATLVHGDFRLGNLMIDKEGLVAALDWELAHRGDPAEDMGWIATPSWRFGAIEKPVGGFGTVAALIEGYRGAGGDPSIDEQAVRFWTILGSLKWGVMCLLMYRAYESGLDRSVERAAIGRRASETELDLVLMLQEKL